jgi:riboflavin synthase
MFTGIVEELGEVVALELGAASARITVRGRVAVPEARSGDSVAVDGVCLTVVDTQPDATTDGPETAAFTADVMLETLDRTALARLTPGARVNLERPLAADGRFGGHVVQGHVDATGQVVERVPGERWEVVRIAVPAGLARYVVEKGSIAIDGVSLTVTEVRDTEDGAVVGVSLIPETLRRTTLGLRAVGDPVNLEVDVLAKYVERMLALPARGAGEGR